MRAQKTSKESNIPFLSPVVWTPGTWAAIVTHRRRVVEISMKTPLLNMYLQAPKDPNDMIVFLFQIWQLFVMANTPKLYLLTSLANTVYLPTPNLHTHYQQSEAVIRAHRSGRSLWNKVGKLTYIPIAPVALATCCLWGKGIFVGEKDRSRERANHN